jgi:hypothetical protein
MLWLADVIEAIRDFMNLGTYRGADHFFPLLDEDDVS